MLAARLVADGYAHFVAHFRAVSDDDYARVVIAEAFAHAPKLDPSGTSWLPAPFWLNGAAMMVFGRSLEVARGVALVLGFASSLLLYAGARLVVRDPRRAALAAALASLLPWSVLLGLATVPELPVVALAFYALATLAPVERDAGRARCLGALALLGASLSRYEAWPIALGFAALTALDALRARGRERALLLASIGGALVGPAAWVVWNRHAHGDAFHFVARVAAFARAAHGAARPDTLGYWTALVADSPGVTLAVCVALGWAALRRAEVDDELRRWGRPALVLVLELALLSLAGLGDAAPTHHPERATLVATLTASIAAAALVVRLAARLGPDRRAAASLALLALGLTSYLGLPACVDRSDEEAAGRAARPVTVPGEVLLVQAVDYGYLAVVASFGRPEDAVTDRPVDPREAPQPSSFDDEVALRAALARTSAKTVVARIDSAAVGSLGTPRAQLGAWAVWRVPPPG